MTMVLRRKDVIFLPKNGLSKGQIATAITTPGSAVAQALSVAGLRDYNRLTALQPFWKALAQRNTLPVDILCIGDSNTEGAQATSLDNRWVTMLLNQLRARFQPAGIVGGKGYFASHYATNTAGGKFFTETGTAFFGSYGLPRRSVLMADGGDKIEGTFRGTSVKVLYAQYNVAGSFTVTIDSVLAGTIVTTNAQLDGQVWTSGAYTSGDHTIVIERASGSVVVDGIFVMDGDESAGIRMWEAGNGGKDSAYFVDPANPKWITTVGAIQPDLVLIYLGHNDYEPSHRTPAAMQTSIQTLITNVRGQCTVAPSIALIVPHKRGDDTGIVAPWDDYRSVYYDIAQADPLVGLVDVGAYFGTTSWTDNLLVNSTDKVHLRLAGHQMYADVLTQFLLPA